MTDDGFVYADGSRVDPQDETDPHTIPDDAARWDDYRDATQRRDSLSRIQTDKLDPIRDRMSDPDNPPDKPAMKGFEDELDKVEAVIELGTIEPQAAAPNVQVTELNVSLPEPL